MDRASTGMRALCKDIAMLREDRSKSIKMLKEQTQTLRDQARNFLHDFQRLHEEMGKNLKKDLGEGKKGLTTKVRTLMDCYDKHEKEVRADLAEARRIWNRMRENLRRSEVK